MFEPRARCERCGRPAAVCYCEALRSVHTRTRVLLLQHPRERDVAINTARIAALALPDAELHTGVTFDEHARVQALLRDPERPAVLLYPAKSARDLRREPPPGPVTLVLLDGTWSQAGKLYRENPSLRALPTYAFEPSAPSNYRIRREPAAHCVATIEALAEVLALLDPGDDPGRFRALLEPFERMVDTQLAYARAARLAGAPPRHARPRAARRVAAGLAPGVPLALAQQGGAHGVLVYGEANAWPFDAPNRPPPEVLHWVALRVGTLERFEAVLAPRRALCPSAPSHARLDEATVRAGLSFEAFEAEFRAFLRPDDTLLLWGSYPRDVLALEAPWARALRSADLKGVVARRLGGPAGAVEACAERHAGPQLAALDAALPQGFGAGRAGARLRAMAGLARWLVAP